MHGLAKRTSQKLKMFWQLNVLEKILIRGTAERFYLIIGGHIYFQTVAAAVQLDLFTFLHDSGGATKEQLCKQLNIAEQPCRILLLGLTSTKLLCKKGDVYTNRHVANIFLSRKSPKNIADVVMWQHFINYKAMYHFHAALLQNKNVGLDEIPGAANNLYERLQQQPELEKTFQSAMQQISVQANQIFADNVDLADIVTLIDVGGGNGSNVKQLVQKFPTLKAYVFDSATVCQKAEENFSASEHKERLGSFVGDCFKDPFPQTECILFCHFFTIWSKEENLSLLKKAYAALPSGGKAIIFNMMQNDSEDGPLGASMGSPYFLTLATGKGMLYSWQEYRQLFNEAGFDQVKSQKLPMQHGCIIGTKR
jgi:hypothetical protein